MPICNRPHPLVMKYNTKISTDTTRRVLAKHRLVRQYERVIQACCEPKETDAACDKTISGRRLLYSLLYVPFIVLYKYSI